MSVRKEGYVQGVGSELSLGHSCVHQFEDLLVEEGFQQKRELVSVRGGALKVCANRNFAAVLPDGSEERDVYNDMIDDLCRREIRMPVLFHRAVELGSLYGVRILKIMAAAVVARLEVGGVQDYRREVVDWNGCERGKIGVLQAQ